MLELLFWRVVDASVLIDLLEVKFLTVFVVAQKEALILKNSIASNVFCLRGTKV